MDQKLVFKTNSEEVFPVWYSDKFCFVLFDSLYPINNLSVMKGWVLLG